MKRPKLIFEIERSSKNGEFFVRVVMNNGKQTFTSGETYKRRGGVNKAIRGLVDAVQKEDYDIRDLT